MGGIPLHTCNLRPITSVVFYHPPRGAKYKYLSKNKQRSKNKERRFFKNLMLLL